MKSKKTNNCENIHEIINNREDENQAEIDDFERLFGELPEEEKEKIRHNLISGMQQYAQALNSIVDVNQEKILDTFQKIAPILEKLFQSVEELHSAAIILGKQQFVWWESLPEDVMQTFTMADTEFQREDIIKKWIRTYNPDALIEQLNKNPDLNECPVYNQSIYAYNNNLYDLAAIGLTACFDRILSLYTGDSTHIIKNRIVKLVQCFMDHEREGTILTNEDYNTMYLYETLTATIDQFNNSIPFVETEPQGINRHWIMHGRMKRKITKLDCIKLINLLYGVIVMKDVG